ncbi:MAG: amino acid adenylation domain-containing protein [Flavobacteriales bacterium]|nr:amino acid adenylation domain-containing protein [Flavobacteriales bacterium]
MEKFIPETRFVPVEHDPFSGTAIDQVIPTTEAQREVLTASEMGHDASCAYNESVSLELNGTLDRASLEKALAQLVDRHVSLRSTISPSGTRMVVAENLIIDLPFHDLSALDARKRDEQLARIAQQDMNGAFNLKNGPLFRAALIKLSPELHHLRLTGHHVVCDGWSLGIMMAEISALYNAAKNGGDPAIPDAVPFSEYALATFDIARSPEQASIENYWLNLFKGSVPRLDLPTDRPRPKQKTYSGKRLDLDLPPELVMALKETATRSGASFVTTLLTVFEVLLHRLTGDSDIVVGLPAAGQSDLDMKHLVGHCVNLLALRSRVDEERPFIDHLRERRTAVLDAFENQKYTFGTLLRTLNVPRQPGRIPLCPVVFNIDMNMDDGVAFDGLAHRFISNPRAFENFELFLNATGNESKLTLEWGYNTDLFDERTIRGWMDELARIAKRVSTNPQASIAEIIGESELTGDRQLPPETWLGNSPDYPRDKSISRLWDETVIRFGERTAVEFIDQRISYAQLDERVQALAAQLMGMGVKPGEPVGLCMERSFDMVAAMLAIMRCGAAFVPFDPSYPADRLQFMFDDTRVNVLITESSLKATLPKNDARSIVLDEQRPAPSANVPAQGGPESPAYIMYTSGSTGTPKGVVVSQRAIVRLVKAQNFLPFGPDLTFLQLSNTSFDASTLEIWGALLNGGRLVLQPQLKPTLLEITDTIREKGVTSVWFTAGLFNVLVDEQLDRLRGLRHILTGGDVLSVPHVKRALKVLGPNVLINGYGPTENTTFTCCHVIDERSIKGSVPIGRPINHTTVHVLDDHMKPVAIGQKGELYTGGDGIALGYWKRPDLTAERFVDDPFSRGGKLYKTGDVVRWTPDGLIEFIGRTDLQVKVRGFRVELGEIENALNDMPGLKDRVVMARDEVAGEKQLVAYLSPTDMSTAGSLERESFIHAAKNHLAERLPQHMVPTAFVVLPEFPLGPNGKVDRKALPAPLPPRPTMRARHVAPRNAVEQELCAIWNKALGAEDIGVHDNFFDMGGHSLTGIQLLAQVEQRFGTTIEFKQLFVAPTVAQMARLIETPVVTLGDDHLLPLQTKGQRVPLICIHGDEANAFLPKYLGQEQPFYGITHQGEDGMPLKYRSVGSIASYYIDELKRGLPEGPYQLCGYSFGGLVAFEMARQLEQRGDKVNMVLLLDTYAPKPFVEVMSKERKLHEPVKNVIMRSVISLVRLFQERLPARLRNFAIIDTYDRAIANYDPGTYKGDVAIIKAIDSPATPDMGWNDLVQGELIRRTCVGDHYTMIKEPLVQQLAEVMAEVMGREKGTSTKQVV